ncbi:proprotein convertase P-domain-containing protein [Sulfidibacter corallicola]|uniref:proprotein convertase P-domain-containing protein n=1 Tax=Sulfidibacter corallicola TaxID=2818388 RepID=UPI001F012402|nr:proprotein convertase P-domain-containing protein [Sulfidibacter corallicola]
MRTKFWNAITAGMGVFLFLGPIPAWAGGGPIGLAEPGGSSISEGVVWARAAIAKRGGPAAKALAAGSLTLVEVRSSLTGTRYRFQQTFDGVPLHRAGVLVVLGGTGGSPVAFFDHCHDLGTTAGLAGHRRAEKRATQDAIDHLKRTYGSGVEVAVHSNQTVYWQSEDRVAPVRRLLVQVGGDVRELLVGEHGRILADESLLASHRHLDQNTATARRSMPAKATATLREALDASSNGKTVVGKGLVFDPDPRTALGRHDLYDDSNAGDFEPAYREVALPDLQQAAGGIGLSGPFVQLTDFDVPTIPPSTREDGQWSARRGDSAFNEVMAYFHIDRNQRYVQSLGFTGARAIWNRPIAVDVHAFNGADISYFDPINRRLAFGNGCVDDAEDADVLLHHYFLALLHDVAPEWGGGDSVAIAAGFGDFWAVSRSLAGPSGRDFSPERVFHWDAYGGAYACWEGRRLDWTEARYLPERLYGVTRDEAGYSGAELWGSALYLAGLELEAAGASLHDLDAIVLESLFGVGYGVTMPQMARGLVAAARALFPEGPHDEVLRQQFLHHQILRTDVPVLALQAHAFQRAGANRRPDPGETVGLIVTIANEGEAALSEISVEIGAVEGVVAASDSVTLNDLDPGRQASNSRQPLRLTVDSAVNCGAGILVPIRVRASIDGVPAEPIELSLPVVLGQPLFEPVGIQPGLVIPDNDETGVSSTIHIEDAPAARFNGTFRVYLDIPHSYVGDLQVSLRTPDGEVAMLVDRPGDGTDEGDRLEGFFPDFVHFGTVWASTLNGDWTLIVKDLAPGDTGYLDRWSIHMDYGTICDVDRDFEPNHYRHLVLPPAEDGWLTTLQVINPGETHTNLSLSGYDASGTLLDRLFYNLAGKGSLSGRVEELFPGNRPAYVQVAAEREVLAYGNSEDAQQRQSVAMNAPAQGTETLIVPHIAEDPAFWTRGTLVNVGEGPSAPYFAGFNDYPIPIELGEPGQAMALDFQNDFFSPPIAAGAGWGRLADPLHDGGALAGVELFGLGPESNYAAGLTLDDRLNEHLIMPHLPADKATWWAGVVLLNPFEEPVSVTARIYPESFDYQPVVMLAEQSFVLEPRTKISKLVDQYFPGTDISAGVWMEFLADRPIAGYTLFGTADQQGDMAGLEGVSGGAYLQALPYLPHAVDGAYRWTGLGFLNLSDQPTSVVLLLYSEQGLLTGQFYEFLMPKGKSVQLLDSEDFDGSTWTDARWIEVRSSVPVVAFQLFGNAGSDMVSGINALRAEGAEVRDKASAVGSDQTPRAVWSR